MINNGKTNPAQAYTDRAVLRGAKKNGSKGALKKRKVYATVVCKKHGKIPMGVSGITLPEVRVGVPQTKRDRFSGCPFCRQTP